MPVPHTDSTRDSARGRVQTVMTLAHLLERVEGGHATVGADQYRALVAQLKAALTQPLPGDALNAVLGAYPATAELYENMHYEVSGLSRTSLERSVSTELQATRLLAQFALGKKPAAGPPPSADA